MTFASRTIDEFLDDIASENVSPSGGAAAAISSATGAALCEMVCIHTIETDDDAEGLVGLREDLGTQRARLLDLAAKDAEVVAAFGERSSTETTRTLIKKATGIPLTIAEASLNVIEHAAVVSEAGNPSAVADAVTGAFLAHSALRASLFTVRTNIESISDEAFIAKTEEQGAELEVTAEEALARVQANVDPTS